jgi:hypothetical protein
VIYRRALSSFDLRVESKRRSLARRYREDLEAREDREESLLDESLLKGFLLTVFAIVASFALIVMEPCPAAHARQAAAYGFCFQLTT